MFEASEPGYHIKFYESPALPEGNHTLIIESKVDGGHFWLDYLVVVSVNTSSPPPLTNGQDCPSFPLPSSTAAGSCSDGAAPSSDHRVLVVASVTLGLVTFIGIVVIVVAVMRRLRNKKSDPLTDQKILADWSSGESTRTGAKEFLVTYSIDRLLPGIERDEKLPDSENESQINKGTNDIVDHRSSLDDLSILSPSTTLRRSMTIDENRLKQLLELDRGSAVLKASGSTSSTFTGIIISAQAKIIDGAAYSEKTAELSGKGCSDDAL
ncbi:hypothetical protein NLJ89_g3872 [Agrocybe chaxingu]|uniref:Uncharacterized protein n=1 Tax=Agrocybe chaxingu TaxID=84603 RepID=A0A9W8KAG3_9AGAR|nr:hypothetical protein NLJ89_g3872 [Agrocybe chaxingu]